MKLDLSHAKSLLDRIRGLRVAVLGDLIQIPLGGMLALHAF